ncbi:unnamed protein product [Ascophyllum nodosum]
MKPDTDPVVFLSDINQICNELGALDETISTERMTTIILDALPGDMYSTVKLEAIRDPDLSLEQTQRMMRTIFINHSERLSVTKNNPEYSKYQGSNRRGRETGRESAMSTALITCQRKSSWPPGTRKKRRPADDVRPNGTLVILSPPHICR